MKKLTKTLLAIEKYKKDMEQLGSLTDLDLAGKPHAFILATIDDWMKKARAIWLPVVIAFHKDTKNKNRCHYITLDQVILLLAYEDKINENNS